MLGQSWLRFRLLGTILALMCLTGIASADDGAPVDGVLSLTPVEENSCLAAWIPIPEGKALTGLRWYNNDETVSFPRLLLASGVPEYPVALTGANVLAEDISGGSSAWSEVSLNEPVVCESAGLYAIFQLPVGAEHFAEGPGGGPAIGYRSSSGSNRGWLSIDGEDWIRLHADHELAIEPVLVDATPGMMSMLSAPSGGVEVVIEPTVSEFETALLPSQPNPFNPKTELRLSLRKEGHAELAIYNLRGELVKRLVREVMPAGVHVVEWHGKDSRGRSVPSGVYLARFRAGNICQTQRLLLVR